MVRGKEGKGMKEGGGRRGKEIGWGEVTRKKKEKKKIKKKNFLTLSNRTGFFFFLLIYKNKFALY